MKRANKLQENYTLLSENYIYPLPSKLMKQIDYALVQSRIRCGLNMLEGGRGGGGVHIKWLLSRILPFKMYKKIMLLKSEREKYHQICKTVAICY